MKLTKYPQLSMTHEFVPLAFETLGPMNHAAKMFLIKLGKRLACASDDPRESSFLFQRLSMIVQRHNAVAFNESFITTSDDELKS